MRSLRDPALRATEAETGRGVGRPVLWVAGSPYLDSVPLHPLLATPTTMDSLALALPAITSSFSSSSPRSQVPPIFQITVFGGSVPQLTDPQDTHATPFSTRPFSQAPPPVSSLRSACGRAQSSSPYSSVRPHPAWAPPSPGRAGLTRLPCLQPSSWRT